MPLGLFVSEKVSQMTGTLIYCGVREKGDILTYEGTSPIVAQDLSVLDQRIR